MGIIGLTGSVGAVPTNGIRLLGGSSQRLEDSSFGPSSLLSGSTQNFAQGLYDNLGVLLGSGPVPANLGQNSPQATRRTEVLNEAATLIDAGDSTGGRAVLQPLLDKNSGDATALRLVAHSYLNERDYKQAERFYGRALAFASNNATLARELNVVRTLQLSDEEVLKQGSRLVQAPSRRQEGRELLLRLTDRSPNNTDAYLALADSYNARREPLELLGALQEAVKSADGRQIDAVIERVRVLVEAQADVGLAHNLLGRALQKSGQTREGLTELKKAADLAPFNFSYRTDYADGLVDRALSKLRRGDLLSARLDLQTVQGLSPSNARLSEVTARVAGEQGRRDINAGLFTKALTQLSVAFNKAPDDDAFKRELSSSLLRLGGHFLAEDDQGSALSAYIKAYELNPQSSTARRNVGELSHSQGLIAIATLSFDTAVTHFERAYDADRANLTYKINLADALDQRGALSLSIGKIDDAIEDFERGLLLDPTNSTLNANYAAALAQKSSA